MKAKTRALVRESSKRASRNASDASPARNFWAVLQANSARKATQRQRFPRSAKSAPCNACEKPPRSPEPWQNRRPFPAKPSRSRRGAAASKVRREQETRTRDERAFATSSKAGRRTSLCDCASGTRGSGLNVSARYASPLTNRVKKGRRCVRGKIRRKATPNA